MKSNGSTPPENGLSSPVHEKTAAQNEDAFPVAEILTRCNDCGNDISSNRLWCPKCGVPIRLPPKQSAKTLDGSLKRRAKLYQQVLEDLNVLERRRQIAAADHYVIHSFYAGKVTEIFDRIESEKLAIKRRGLLEQVRADVRAGRLIEARANLERELAEHEGDVQLQQMLAEISGKLKQKERALRDKRRSRELWHDSLACLEKSRLEQSRAKIKEAIPLDPRNPHFKATLKTVEARIKERDLSRKVNAEKERLAAIASAPAAESRQPPLQKIPEKAPASQATLPTFDEEDVPSSTHRIVEAASNWSRILKPFLLDNVGWFVGAFLVIAGFIVLIVTFWSTIGQNEILMHSLVFFSILAANALFFSAAYFMRLKYPQLEFSSDVLLVIVALLIPLAFAAAVLTALVSVPGANADLTFLQEFHGER